MMNDWRLAFVINRPFHKLRHEQYLPRFETIALVIISLETSNHTLMKGVHI